MNTKDKAKLLYCKYDDDKVLASSLSKGSVAFKASMEMAEWKEQQIEKKIALFIKNNLTNYLTIIGKAAINEKALLEDIIQTIKKD